MAKPMTADQFLKALRAEGVKVEEHSGWRTHNRNGKGAWGPLYGVMVHHTAGLDVAEYVHSGSAELPGPLCHGYIDKTGTVHLIGWGRANHAGGGDPDVLAAVKEERHPLPKTDEHQGSDGAVDGNAHFVGYECENLGNGKDPWPAVQLEAMVRACAAVCRFYGWSARSVIRHLDWSDHKSDPKGVNWQGFQQRVQALLDEDPAEPPTTPGLPVVSLSNVVAAARRDPAAPQGSALHRQEVDRVEEALVKLGFLAETWADGSYGTKTVAAYAALQRHLGYSGSGADGIPGAHSLTWLGLKSGLFRKVA